MRVGVKRGFLNGPAQETTALFSDCMNLAKYGIYQGYSYFKTPSIKERIKKELDDPAMENELYKAQRKIIHGFVSENLKRLENCKDNELCKEFDQIIKGGKFADQLLQKRIIRGQQKFIQDTIQSLQKNNTTTPIKYFENTFKAILLPITFPYTKFCSYFSVTDGSNSVEEFSTATLPQIAEKKTIMQDTFNTDDDQDILNNSSTLSKEDYDELLQEYEQENDNEITL